MSEAALNPRAVSGANQPPDWARDVTDRMAADYAELARTVQDFLEEARDLPANVESESDLRMFSDVVVRLRDAAARAESARKAEKEPYLRGGQAVDGFFTNLTERLDKGVRALTRRVNEYQQRKLAEERARRERERLEAERLAREARERAEEEARRAEEARLAAERARKRVDEKREVAIDAASSAESAKVDAMLRQDDADAARTAAAQKPSAMARSRFDEGRLVTMKQVGYVEITDKMALDSRLLWPFVKDEHALQALRAWAKTTGFKQQMDGAIVELRDDTVIR